MAESLDDFSTDPTARWAAVSGAVWAWDSANSEMDADATVSRWAQRYTTDTGSIENEAQATFLLAGAASTDQIGGGGGRIHATNDDFYFPVVSAVNDTVILYKHVAGVRTTLATFNGYTAVANEFHTVRSAYAGAAGSNVVISIWRTNHGTTKPADPGWYGANGTPDHTYTDTAADRLDDATHLYNGIVGQGQGGDYDTRHCFYKERAISDRTGGGAAGTIAQTLSSFSPSMSGTTTVTGSIANTLSTFVSSVSGTTTVQGTIGNNLSAFVPAMQGSTTVTGATANTLAPFTSNISGTTGSASGTIAATLGAFTANIVGRHDGVVRQSSGGGSAKKLKKKRDYFIHDDLYEQRTKSVEKSDSIHPPVKPEPVKPGQIKRITIDAIQPSVSQIVTDDDVELVLMVLEALDEAA